MKILKKVMKTKAKKDSKNIVIFMSAYKSSGISKRILSFQKRKKIKDLLSKYHIQSLLINDSVITPKGCLTVETNYNYIEQSATYSFNVKNSKQTIKDFEEELSDLKWCFSIQNSLQLLLDVSYYNIPFYINMESFLVYYNDAPLQVDPVIFCLNDILMITFELIDYTTGNTFGKENIFGRKNNCNIKPVNSYQYFGEDKKSADNRTIPQIIFDNIINFLNGLMRNKYKSSTISYVHNFLVVSNSNSTDINQYFSNVLDAENIDLHLANLNTNNCYQYYSKEFLGLVLYLEEEHLDQALYDSIVLESLKMTILLNQIVNHEITSGLDETINNIIYTNILLLSSKTPIVTQNVIENIQQTETYKRNQKAIENKITYLNIKNERRKNKNSLLLNILLYVLSFIGSIGTIQVFKEEFGWSFNICFIIILSVFSLLGFLWMIFEIKKK